MNFNDIVEKLKKTLSSKRFRHSVGVSTTAERLALQFGCPADQAKLAGILHDCAREIPNAQLLLMAKSFGIVIGEVENREPVLLHAWVGAKLAQAEYGISDPEICRAIALHTTGGAGMSVLAKILFVADMIEPGRSFPGVDKLRRLAGESLDAVLLASYNQSLLFLIERNGSIHPDTIYGRNELLR